MVINTCPSCLKNNTKLVKHHWFEDDNYNSGYIKFICYRCNSILKTISNNHVLPTWDKQAEYIHLYLKSHPNETRYSVIANILNDITSKLRSTKTKKELRLLLYNCDGGMIHRLGEVHKCLIQTPYSINLVRTRAKLYKYLSNEYDNAKN